MTISERKKALSSVATTERYLKTRWDKMQTEEDVINQPLNEDVNVCDPEMRQYFPRIFVRSPENTLSRTLVTLFRFHLLNLISIYWLIVQLRIQLINIIIQIYYFFVVLLRTAIEFLFDYAFYVIFADHFFNWMPEQYLWLVLTIVFILTKLFTVRSVYPVMAEFRVLLIVQNRRLSSCWQWWPFPLLQSWWVTPLSRHWLIGFIITDWTTRALEPRPGQFIRGIQRLVNRHHRRVPNQQDWANVRRPSRHGRRLRQLPGHARRPHARRDWRGRRERFCRYLSTFSIFYLCPVLCQ